MGCHWKESRADFRDVEVGLGELPAVQDGEESVEAFGVSGWMPATCCGATLAFIYQLKAASLLFWVFFFLVSLRYFLYCDRDLRETFKGINNYHKDRKKSS